ncbi:MAG TPA: purine-nucleoside phosphorylase [Longimicrobiales bacterium]|nr:purine-nucleoside phosphorylase [Longimicrobiales bacterium]
MTDATYEDVRRAADAVREATDAAPAAALVLGTGLGGLSEAIEDRRELAYGAIPGFPVSTAESHAGRLVVGSLEGVPVAALDGRFHRYEGYELSRIGFPIRVLRELGAEVLVVSAACGCMNPLWERGDVVLLSDHVNLMGGNPLVGPNLDEQGPRFPDMSEAYDRELRERARAEALAAGLRLREGVYAAVTGPSLETAAEYRMLRAVGADVVGMSTVPEVIVANHVGLRVLGLAVVTDMALPDALEPVDVEEIIATARETAPALTRLVRGVLAGLAGATGDRA